MEKVTKIQRSYKKINNVTTSEDASKVIQEFEQNIKNEKATYYYGWLAIKDKYFRSLKKKNDL